MLVPEDFDVRRLRNEAEERVVAACVHGLSDGWLVLPDVGIKVGTRDHQLDVVLVHPQYGVIDLEVKGHQPELRHGDWYAHGSRMEPQPSTQAHNNAYALRDLLRSKVPGLTQLKVPYAVAFPNATQVSGELPPDLKPVQVITAEHLDDLADVVEVLAFLYSYVAPLDGDDVAAIVEVLRPNCGFEWDPGARARFARRRLDDLCTAQIRSLETLDRNRRVCVLGAAGTGKTRLVEAWARRAYVADERVLVTCYNEPLAAAIAGRLPDDPDALVVGPFQRLALELPGMPPLAIPPDADHAWWTDVAPAHVVAHWDQVTARFDVIVVDEGQDFSPAWLALLERLLAPDGRLLVVADPAQELYVRGFAVPEPDQGWAVCELVANCRNAQQIARLLRAHLGGGAAPAVAPEAIGIGWWEVGSAGNAAATDVVDQVRDVLDELLGDEGRDPASIVVLTCASALRDRLRAEADLGVVRWEERNDDAVLVENVHRVKGLEADTVILVADAPVPDDLLYVGISRAVSELVLVAPRAVAERLRLA